jgi:hypothetical protein
MSHTKIKLGINQKKRLVSFEKWFYKMVDYQKKGYTILDVSQNCIAGEFKKTTNDDGFVEYGEYHENVGSSLFEINPEFDHGLYTPMWLMKEQLQCYKVFKEIII